MLGFIGPGEDLSASVIFSWVRDFPICDKSDDAI
jgi:hypothetical protein